MKIIKNFSVLRTIFLGSSIIILTLPVLAQETIIKGQVIDRENKPLANAQITFYDLSKGTRFSVKTKKDGTYLKAGLPPSTYKVTVSSEGYFPFETTLKIEFAREQMVNFTLEKIPPKVEDDPDFKEGLKYFESGNFELAAAAFEKAAQRLPQNIEANYNLAICYLRLQKIAEAIEILEKMLLWKNDLPEVYLALGEAYFDRGETEKALVNFKRAQELKPGDHRIHYNLALIYYKNDQLEAATSSLIKALEINPRFAPAYYQLGLVFIKRGDLAKAVENLEKFLELEPESKEAAQIKAVIEELKKKVNSVLTASESFLFFDGINSFESLFY